MTLLMIKKQKSISRVARNFCGPFIDCVECCRSKLNVEQHSVLSIHWCSSYPIHVSQVLCDTGMFFSGRVTLKKWLPVWSVYGG